MTPTPAASYASSSVRQPGSLTVSRSMRREARSGAGRSPHRANASRSTTSQSAWLTASRRWLPAARPVPFARKQPRALWAGRAEVEMHALVRHPERARRSARPCPRSTGSRDRRGTSTRTAAAAARRRRPGRLPGARGTSRGEGEGGRARRATPRAASMIPETLAAIRSTPFPCDTESDRPFGRQTITTGMPITSSPVITATRVIPTRGRTGRSRSSVAAGSTVRCVPSRWSFSAAASGVTDTRRLVPGED